MGDFSEFDFSADFAGLESADASKNRGDKVLWLHGYTLNSYSWRPVWELLPGWHHLGLDLPGHGRSPAITHFEDLKDVGKRLGEVCQAHEIRHVVALSFGTVIATQLAIEYPDYLSSLTLAAPSLAGAPQDDEVGEAYEKLFAHFFREGPGEKLSQLWMTNPAWRGIDSNLALKQSLRKLIDQHSWQEIRSFGMMRLIAPPQTEEQLTHIKTPTMIMFGDREMPAFKACAKSLSDNLVNSTSVTLPDTDHLCLLQVPELATTYIERHLSAHQR